MSRLFRRLAARARNEEHSVMPRVRGLFEPTVSAQQGMVEVTEEVDRKFRGDSHSDVSAPPAAAPIVAGRGKTETVQQSPADSPPTDVPGAEQSVRPYVQQAPTAQSEPVEPATHTEHHFKHTETLRERIEETPVWRLQEGQAPEASPAPAMAPSAFDTSPAKPDRGQDDDAIRLDPPQPEPMPAAHSVAMPPEYAAPQPANREAAPLAGRTVHIHVDRIEVRGVTKPNSPAAARKRIDNPAPGLEEYLRGGRS